MPRRNLREQVGFGVAVGAAAVLNAAAASNIPTAPYIRCGRLRHAFLEQEPHVTVPKSPRSTRSRTTRPFVFTQRNYVLIVAGVLAVVLGYALMAIENEVYGFISLYVAPIIILGGYLGVIYGIMWKPDDEKESHPSTP